MHDDRNRIDSVIEKVLQVIDTEGWEYKDLFMTERGKRLGRTLADVEEFTIKGVSLSLFMETGSTFPRLSAKWMQSEGFNEMVKEKIDDSDRDIIEAIRTISIQEPQLFDEIESDGFFKVEDHMRFFAYFVFSVCAYLDGFVQELTEEISEELLKNANTYDKVTKRKYLRILRKIFMTERYNAYDRIKALLKSLRVSKAFNKSLEVNGLKHFETYFEEFIGLRNVIAHKSPHPTQTIFTAAPQLKAYLERHMPMITDTQEEPPEIPEEFREALKQIFDVLNENMLIITAIDELTTIIQIYIALVDNIIEMELKYFSNSATEPLA